MLGMLSGVAEQVSVQLVPRGQKIHGLLEAIVQEDQSPKLVKVPDVGAKLLSTREERSFSLL